MSRKKILFVLRDFAKAGAQRFQYEIIRELNKDKFEIDILAVQKPSDFVDGFGKSEHYYPLIKEHVNSIQYLADVGAWHGALSTISKIKSKLKKSNPLQHLLDFLAKRFNQRHNRALADFLKPYRYILATEYDYCIVKDSIGDTERLVTLQMTASIQTHPKSQFDDHNPNTNYWILTGWHKRFAKSELSYFNKGYRLINFPYTLRPSEYEYHEPNIKKDEFHIGVFTRISPLKPIAPYLFGLHLLRAKGLNVHLHLFGTVSKHGVTALMFEEIKRNIKILQIEEYVMFEGHSDDFSTSVKDKGIGLAWCQGLAQQIGGYAALELMLLGVPHVFWDFDPQEETSNQGGSPIPYFWELDKFVEYTGHLLSEPRNLLKSSKDQRLLVRERFDTKKYIGNLEAHLAR